ncbi:glycosyltransferase [uncultured Microbacterium sp.]|uniref:glycosyltransferase n=1 Tax=uncultured Microbacterium sp. TaxID=191216 RepID=UPI0037DD3779
MTVRSHRPDALPRIVHLDHTSVAGGAEYALVRMLRASPRWHPLVLVPRGSSAGVFAELGETARIRECGVRQRAGVSAGAASVLFAAGAGLAAQSVATRMHPGFRSADIVDANTSRAAAYGALAAWSSRTPFVVHVRDMTDAEAMGRFGSLAMRKVALPRADGVIADTHAALESAARFLRPDAVTAVIPSASGVRRSLTGQASSEPLRVGMLARIDPWKGQRLLIDAFAAAFAGSEAVLEFAGAAPFGHEQFATELRSRAAELGLGERVRFLGHVADVDELLAGWDIAVQASTRPEPLGQNVLQYLAAGCAVVVADEGGPVEWVDDGVNGLRFAPRDGAALTAALRRLGADPELRVRMGHAARRTPGLMEDAEVAAAHAEFYADVLSRAER